MECKKCKEVVDALGEFHAGLNDELTTTIEAIDQAFAALLHYINEMHKPAKACLQCGATETPQWRTYDDKLFCNACGIRYYRTVK